MVHVTINLQLVRRSAPMIHLGCKAAICPPYSASRRTSGDKSRVNSMETGELVGRKTPSGSANPVSRSNFRAKIAKCARASLYGLVSSVYLTRSMDGHTAVIVNHPECTQATLWIIFVCIRRSIAAKLQKLPMSFMVDFSQGRPIEVRKGVFISFC